MNRQSLMVLVAILGALASQVALGQATPTLTINIVEQNNDVVATVSGSVNTAGMTASPGSPNSTSIERNPSFGSTIILTSSSSSPTATEEFTGFLGAPAFPAVDFTTATGADAGLGSGALNGQGSPLVGLSTGNANASPAELPKLTLGTSYVSGDTMNFEVRWQNKTITGMKLNPGVYTWTLANGDEIKLTIQAAAPSTFTIGGSVSGLATGKSLELINNGTETLSVTANGAFVFASPVSSGGAYAVSIGTQPNNQTCTVTNGSGTASANVTNVEVTCVTKPALPVPTLSPALLALMMLLMAGIGVFSVRMLRH